MLVAHVLDGRNPFPGKLFLDGVWPENGTFTINFIDGNGATSPHLSFRTDKAELVINENLVGRWGDQHGVPEIPYAAKKPLFICVAATSELKISTAGHWRTKRRRRRWRQGWLLNLRFNPKPGLPRRTEE